MIVIYIDHYTALETIKAKPWEESVGGGRGWVLSCGELLVA